MLPRSGNTYYGGDELKKLTLITPQGSDTMAELKAATNKSTDDKGGDTAAPRVKATKVTISADAITSLGEQLDKVLSQLTLQDEPLDKEVDRASKLIKAYLFEKEYEFRRVLVYRDRGWHANKEQGDAFFKLQREQADNADEAGEKRFFEMMKEIAIEMDLHNEIFSPPVVEEREFKVFDICMAPGGYSAAILKLNKKAKIFGVTLPKADGGHPLMISMHRMEGCKLMDVTMLVSEFTKGTDRTILKTHPDYDKFIPTRPFVCHKMDVVLCDGMVLRNHERASYRQHNEAIRLSTAQLILGMQRIIQGGTFIMLLHKIDSWAAASICYTFNKFSKIGTFKPFKKHGTRSSFYMIAKDVQVESLAALAAIADWKTKWYEATFGSEHDAGGAVSAGPDEKLVLQAIEEFGPKLIDIGREVWKIQADALSKTQWAGDAKKGV